MFILNDKQFKRIVKCVKPWKKDYNGICVPIPSDDPYEYWETETMTGKGLLSMKHVAVACGIGQIGKSSLLLNPEY